MQKLRNQKPLLRKLSLYLLIASLFACTGNPFDDSQEIRDITTIRGTVRLSDNASPANIFVWLESVEVSAFTDADGNFSLTLPPAGQQGGATLDGAFDLYFYMANYRYATANIAIRDGALLVGEGDLDENGKLKSTITLSKLLDVIIRTELSPPVAYRNVDSKLIFRSTLTAVGGSTVEVLGFGADSGPEFLGALFLRPIENGVPAASRAIFSSQNNTQRTITSTPQEFVAEFSFPDCSLQSGPFQARPFLWVRQAGLPDRLIEALGAIPETLSFGFENIPFSDLRYFGFTIGPEKPPDEFGFPRPCP